MNTEDREQWLAERKHFIGASESPSVMGVGDYACARKVYYGKTGEIPDFISDSKSAQRGRDLEDYVAKLYSQRTGLRLTPGKTYKLEHKKYFAGTPDRVIHYPDGSQGTLQIKVVGIWSWKKILENGIPEDYIIQIQQELRAAGLKRGAYAVFCADILAGQGWELMFWDFQEDTKLQDIIEDKVTEFWKTNVHHKIIPPQLPQPSLPCPGCEYRVTCLGTPYPPLMPKKPRKKKGDKDESATSAE